MSDKIKEVMQTPEVPEELLPENIPALIERNKIGQTGRKSANTKNIIKYVSAIAACGVIAVGAVNIIPSMNNDELTNEPIIPTEISESEEAEENSENESVVNDENLYFVHPESYEDIYKHLRHGEPPKKENGITDFINSLFGGVKKNDYATNEGNKADIYYDDAVEEEMEMSDAEVGGDVQNNDMAAGSSDDVYETLQQVEGIAEADIIKANSENIYFIPNTYSDVIVSVAINSDGTFGGKEIIDLSDNNDDIKLAPSEMYLAGEKLVLIGNCEKYIEDNYVSSYMNTSVVMIFDISDGKPELKEKYYQSGCYQNSRMKDNILYLITNQNENSSSVYNKNQYEKYIPSTGTSIDDMKCVDEEYLYMPKDWEDDINHISYVNIAGIDINNAEKPVSMASIAGYSGNMYCSNDNIYIAQQKRNDTEITRFSIDNGKITAEKSGKVKGYVLNQFSMDEYNGYFRIATTSNNDYYYDVDEGADGWSASYSNGRSNNVFVLDKDMNIVGAITGIAKDESIKSVTFQGKIGYVVTYRQTDPLYAIDFSDPENPVITDEFKINGYSSFLHKWNDDLLLGFGIDATEEAIEVGVKLVMFDVSDNEELKEVGFASISGDSYHEVYSTAVYERKALLLNAERNIIGFPTTAYNNGVINAYHLFKYENGRFKETGQIISDDNSEFTRAVYAGNYIYMFTQNHAVSADIKTMTVKDEIEFDIGYQNPDYVDWID